MKISISAANTGVEVDEMKTSKRRLLTYVAWVAVLCGVTILTTGVASDNEAGAADKQGITVRVLLYSGREDPTYVIDDPQMIGQMKARLGDAKKAADFGGETVIPSILGYKGILVDNPGMAGDLPRQFAVYKGTIEVMGRDRQFLVDEEGALEKMLMDESIRKGVIDEAILKRKETGQ